MKEKKADLKAKWQEIKDGYTNLQNLKGVTPNNSSFSNPKVARLWKSALQANFSEIELDSFKVCCAGNSVCDASFCWFKHREWGKGVA